MLGTPSTSSTNSTSSSDVSGTSPIAFGLEQFGIKSSTIKDKTNTALMQYAIIPGPAAILLVKHAPNGAYTEKVQNDAIRSMAPWIKPLDPISTTFAYHVNDVEVKNARNYPVRLFGFRCGIIPEDAALVNLGNYMCSKINETKGLSAKIMIDKNRLFFTPTRLTTWSEVTGKVYAMRHLQEEAGESIDHGNANFYEKHKDLVYSHFPKGKFTPAFAQLTGAPRDEIDPVMLEDLEKEQRALEQSNRFNLQDTDDEDDDMIGNNDP